jgi:tRNA uridine 5-carboxymethylaminomethyl modification enzyme
MDYEAIVIGGGHAGIEASLALARLGHSTLLVTQNPDAIGRMSCNPSIGGLGKGNLVREIDALGGEMAKLTDASMLQYRVLNRSRGPAVQAPRAQADKAVYSGLARRALESQAGLTILMDTVVDLLVDASGSHVEGVLTERGAKIGAAVVVLAAGTFMEGKLFIGEWSAGGGRLGEGAALGLGDALRRRGFKVGRLKTGTPARVARSSVDTSRLAEESGEAPKPFSFAYDAIDDSVIGSVLPCWVTYTTAETHRIIRENLGSSPLYSGKIVGTGPRYCPSIETKIVRFPERERHQIFIEPEGAYTDELYLNGLSSSLPEKVQEAFIHTIPGLEKTVLVRPGYAVEYDYLDPVGLFPSLESRALSGFFVAGQTNGSSGYEEAAAQGLLAGINASRRLSGEEPLVLSRAESYMGVLVDDLTTLGVKEPYRMFTSRAERRLSLRCDTADERLTPIGHGVGLVDEERWSRFEKKRERLAEAAELVRKRRIARPEALAEPLLEPHIGESLADALRDPKIEGGVARFMPELSGRFPKGILETVYLDLRYEGYAEREKRLAARFDKADALRIPEGFDYRSIEGLSAEAREKLEAQRPVNLGQASRIQGVRRADAALLMVRLLRAARDRAERGKAEPVDK